MNWIDMKYNLEQYTTLSERFNSQTFLGKLITIKNNPEIFTIELDGTNVRLRLEEDAQKAEIDLLFSFPVFLEYSHLKDIFSLSDINIKELK